MAFSWSPDMHTLCKRILILEDQDSLRRVLSRALHEAGYATYPAATFDQVQGLLAHNQFDVFLCHAGQDRVADLVREHAAALKADGTRVVMVSASLECRGQLEETGVDLHLQKPIAVPALIALVHGLTNHHHPQAACAHETARGGHYAAGQDEGRSNLLPLTAKQETL